MCFLETDPAARADDNGETLEDGQQNCDFNGQKFSSHSEYKISLYLINIGSENQIRFVCGVSMVVHSLNSRVHVCTYEELV